MWEVQGTPIFPVLWDSFEPNEIFCEFDGPRTFTVAEQSGELCLAHWAETKDELNRYIVVPTSTHILKKLKDGVLSVREALDQPRCWICDINDDGEVTQSFLTDFSSIPYEFLPSPGTMLFPELEPLLTLRAVGLQIVPGKVPGSVIRICVEGAQKSFKYLSEYVLGKQSQGRPDEFLRRLFDLPTQRVAFSSFEVSFRMPVEHQNLFTLGGEKTPERETLDEVQRLLNKGLDWLTSAAGAEGVFNPEDPEEGTVILRALKELTPSSQGSIEKLELKGQFLDRLRKPLVLNQLARKRVNAAIRTQSLEPRLVDLEGRIRELDKDRLSFELREIEAGPSNQRFVFDEELLEDVFQALEDDVRVRVGGTAFPVKNVAYALAISRLVEK